MAQVMRVTFTPADPAARVAPSALNLPAVSAAAWSSLSMDTPSLVVESGGRVTLYGTVTPAAAAAHPEMAALAALRGSASTSVSVSAQLHPVALLSAAPLGDAPVAISTHVSLQNMTIHFDSAGKAVTATATLVIQPSAADPALQLALAGTASATGFDLSGSEANPSWPLPGVAAGEVALTNALAHVRFASNETPKWSGALTAGAAYKAANFEVRISIPPVGDTAAGLAIEAFAASAFPLAAISPATSPVGDVLVLKAALVFSPAALLYSFADVAAAPTPTLDCVRGLNLAVRADISAAAALAGFRRMTGAPAALTDVLFVGSLSSASSLSSSASAAAARTWMLSAAVSGLALGDDFLVQTGSLRLASASPFLTLAADVLVAKGVLTAPAPIVLTMAGELNADTLSLSGVLAAPGNQWVVRVGSRSIALTQVTASLTHNFASKTTTAAAMSAALLLDASTPATVRATYPVASAKGVLCTAMEVDLATTAAAASVGQLVSAVLGRPAAGGFPDVEAQVLSQLLDDSLSNVVLRLAPRCGNFSAAATLTTSVFGAADVSIVVEKDAAGAWQWHMALLPGAGWVFASSSLVPAGFPHLNIVDPAFVLSSAGGELDLMRRDGTALKVTVAPGSFSVFATLLVAGSERMELLRALEPGSDTLALSGTFSATAWAVSATLTAAAHPFDLGHGMTLTAAAVTIQPSPPVALSCALALTLPGAAQPFGFTLSGEVVDNGFVTLTGASTPGATLPLSPKLGGIVLTSLAAALRVQWAVGTAAAAPPVAVTGSLSGAAALGAGGAGVLQLELDLLAAEALHFTAALTASPPLSLRAVLVRLLGHTRMAALPVTAAAATAVLDAALVSGSIDVWAADAAPSVTLSGDMKLFASATNAAVMLHVAEAAAAAGGGAKQLEFAAGVALGDGPFAFASAFPDTPADLSGLSLLSAALGVASAATELHFPGTPDGVTFAVPRGLSVFGSLNLAASTDARMQWLHRWSGVDALELAGDVTDATHFDLRAQLAGDVRIGHFADIYSAGVFVRVVGADVQVGMSGAVGVNLTHRADDHLLFSGDLFVATAGAGAGFDAAMVTDWVNPLGALPGLVIERADLSLELSAAAGVPVSVGVAGGLRLGPVAGRAAVWVDAVAVPAEAMVSAELEHVFLDQLLDALLTELHVPVPGLLNTLTRVGFNSSKLYVNPSPNALTFFGTTYPGGEFSLDVEGFDLWGMFRGTASVAVDEARGLAVDAQLEAVDLLGNGGVVISGFASATSPVQLRLHALTAPTDVSLLVDGALQIFGSRLPVLLDVSDTHFTLDVNITLLHDLFDFSLLGTAQGAGALTGAPSEFALAASVSNRLQDWIAVNVPKEVDGAVSDFDQRVALAKSDLAEKMAALNDVTARVTARKAADQGHMSKVEADLNSAQCALVAAKQKVDSMQAEVDAARADLRASHWYQVGRRLKDAAVISGMEIANTAADGALIIAEDAVKAAAHAVGVVPQLDPVVVSLELEHGVALAAFELATATLSGVQKLVDGAGRVADWLAHETGTALNIEHANLSGALSKVAAGDFLDLGVAGVFCGKRFDVSVRVDLATIDSFAKALWEALVKLF